MKSRADARTHAKVIDDKVTLKDPAAFNAKA